MISNFLAKSHEYFPLFSKNDLINDIWQFLGEYYNNPLRTSEEVAVGIPSLDEVFTNIDYALVNNCSLTPFYDPARLQRVKRSLIALIDKTLTATITDTMCHDTLITKIVRARTIKPILISLNYDCIVDRCLARHKRLNYGFASAQSEVLTPILIKLHGSLNWSYCSLCEQIEIHGGDHHPCDTEEELLKCTKCGCWHTQPLLITPTLFKSYSIPPLKQLWSLALMLLSEVEKIVVIGYSMPANDVAVIQLLKRAFAIGGKTPKMLVVDINKKITNRYRQIFGGQIPLISKGFSLDSVDCIVEWLKK